MKRIKYIDVAKGIGIYLVVLGHVSANTTLGNYISSFRMPLFFFLSGLTTKFTSENFLIKKIKTLLIPYYFWYFIFFIYWFFFEREFRDSNVNTMTPIIGGIFAYCKNDYLLPNVVLWFLPSLFTVECLGCLVVKSQFFVTKFSKLGIIIVFAFLGLILNYFSSYSFPFCFETSLLMLPLYLLAYYSKDMINHFKITILFKSICAIMILCLFAGTKAYGDLNGRVDLREGILNNYLLYYLLSLIGIFLIVIISKGIEQNRILTYLGRTTLAVTIFHDPLKRILLFGISKIINVPIEQIRDSFLQTIIISCVIIILILPAKSILGKYMPWSLGISLKSIKK